MHGLHEIIAMNEVATANAAPLPTVGDVREHVAKEIDRLVNSDDKSPEETGALAALLGVAGVLREDLSAIPFHNALRLVDGDAPFGTCPDGSEAWGPWSNWPRRCDNR